VLFFMHLRSRQIHVAGVMPHPNAQWMMQIARNVTMAEWGFLSAGQYLNHDRDGKFHIPLDLVVECVTTQRKPPEVRICRLRNQSAVGTRPPGSVANFEG